MPKKETREQAEKHRTIAKTLRSQPGPYETKPKPTDYAKSSRFKPMFDKENGHFLITKIERRGQRMVTAKKKENFSVDYVVDAKTKPYKQTNSPDDTRLINPTDLHI